MAEEKLPEWLETIIKRLDDDIEHRAAGEWFGGKHPSVAFAAIERVATFDTSEDTFAEFVGCLITEVERLRSKLDELTEVAARTCDGVERVSEKWATEISRLRAKLAELEHWPEAVEEIRTAAEWTYSHSAAWTHKVCGNVKAEVARRIAATTDAPPAEPVDKAVTDTASTDT